MKFRNLILATAGLLFFGFTSLAQITAIEGDVKGDDGKPLVGAVVKIDRYDITAHYKTKTDKKGHYFYNGLPLGNYNVTIEVDGKDVDQTKGVRSRLGDPTNVSFNLQASKQSRDAAQAAMQKAAEGGQLPKDMERGMTAAEKAAWEKTLKEREGQLKQHKELNDAFNAGMTAMADKQYDQAVQALTKASEIGPQELAVWANLADAYMKLAGTKTGPEFDDAAQKGLDAYSKAIALKPEDAATHNNYALALVQAKKIPEAQAELTKAAQLDPTNAGKYYYNLGAVLTNANQADAAADAFQKAIAADPKYAEAYYQYGVYLVGKASFGADGKVTPVPGTVEQFQKYLELAPTGQFAQPAKDMLATLSATVDVSYKNPNAKEAPKKKK
ncbi:MAG: carboxypeptidase regulatory-like domain-containing protein [Bryobacteraceae bacterium]|jgi:tetratricopeptide (TPR) repeat protein